MEEDIDVDHQVTTNTKVVDVINHLLQDHLDPKIVEEGLHHQNHQHLLEKDLNLIEKILRIKKNLHPPKQALITLLLLVLMISKINNRIMMEKMKQRKIKKNNLLVDLNPNLRIQDLDRDRLHHQALKKKITRKTTEAQANPEVKANNLLNLIEIPHNPSYFIFKFLLYIVNFYFFMLQIFWFLYL